MVNRRILDIVSYRFLPFSSGGQKSIALFLETLGEITSLHVAGTKDNDISKANNYTLHPILSESKYRYIDLGNIFRLRRIIVTQKIDTLIIEHPYIGWLGVILKWITGVKLIIHTHNIEYERFKSIGKWWWGILKMYETWVLKNANVIFCISDEDKTWMTQKMKIIGDNCIVIPYGITQEKAPDDKHICKEQVCKKHGLNPTIKLLFFNGLLSYEPNTKALRDILENINPILLKSGIEYNILIAGKNLPEEFEGLKKWNNQHVFYAGFVDDIDLYTKASDIFLNPVNIGGGVKTKMIEALGLGATVVATENGAIGVDKNVCGEKLKVVENNDWEGFTNQIIQEMKTESQIPDQFYNIYNWNKITSKAVSTIYKSNTNKI